MGKKKEDGYQPSKMLLGAIKPPSTGSNVVVPKKFSDKAINSMIRSLAAQPSVEECVYDSAKQIFTVTMFDDKQYVSADGEAWYKPNCVARVTMPWEKASDPVKTWEMAQASVMKGLMDDPYGDATPTQRKIREITDAMKDLLLYKNNKYGDSAISPKKVFYKGDSTNSILIRLDDKIGRVMANTEDKPRVNDVCDIIGYCTLLLISMGVTADDIAKFKD